MKCGLTLLLLFVTIACCNSLPTKEERKDELPATIDCYVTMGCGDDPVPGVHSITNCCKEKNGINYREKGPGNFCTACPDDTMQDGIVQGTLANVNCYTDSRCSGRYKSVSFVQCCSGGVGSCYKNIGSKVPHKCKKNYGVQGTLANVKCYANSLCSGSYSSKSTSQCCSGGVGSYKTTGGSKCNKCSKNYEDAAVVQGALANVKCFTKSKCSGSYSSKSTSQCCSGGVGSYQKTAGSTCTECSKNYEDAGVVQGALANVKCFANSQCSGTYKWVSKRQCCPKGVYNCYEFRGSTVPHQCTKNYEDTKVVQGTLANVKCYTTSQCSGSYSSKSTSQCCSGGVGSYKTTDGSKCNKCPLFYDVQLNQRRL